MYPCNMNEFPISELIKTLEEMDDPETQAHHRKCKVDHKDTKYRSSRGVQLKKLKKRNGLCLDCIRLQADAQKGACRVPHS